MEGMGSRDTQDIAQEHAKSRILFRVEWNLLA